MSQGVHSTLNKVFYAVCGLLISIVLGLTGYIMSSSLTKLTSIQSEIAGIRCNIVQLEASIENKYISEDRIRNIINYQILKYHQSIK